ncbi:hypothetical protein Pmani_013022 [Petrolisthes manimaculis]|uniref:Uncharacterized protein n=1 Tax=Petrolisthes manimaculis TaxID=1843537 RepID=A0AAE1UEJ1_9EUCA|nr:hypothetical protein Pmani_013022 [Petrolisthes manimaculis]
MSDLSTNLETFKSQLKNTLSSLDLSTVAAVLLVVAGAILLYDLLVVVVASASTRRSLMVTPTLAHLASTAWTMRDDLGLSNMIEYRSFQSAYPVLEAIRQAMEKYQHQD